MARKEKMVKSELVSVIAHRLDMPKVDVDKIIDACFEEIGNNIIKGNRIMLTGFGRFDTRVRSARRFYNPLKNEHFDLPSTVIPIFKFSTVLKDKVEESFSLLGTVNNHPFG